MFCLLGSGIMELMAEGWTEERLDDLKGQVKRLERRTDEGFRSLREEMDRRFDQAAASVDARFEAVDQRFEVVDQRFEGVDQQFEGVNQRFDFVDQRLDDINGHLHGIDGRFEVLDGRLYAIHRTLVIFLASMFAGLLGLVAALVATQS